MASRIGLSASRLPLKDHPGGERSGALVVEGVEGPVDDLARIGLALARALDDLGDLGGHPLADQPRQLGLKAGGRAEMVEQIGVGLADPGADRLQGHRLRPRFDQQARAPPRARRPGSLPGSGVHALLTSV